MDNVAFKLLDSVLHKTQSRPLKHGIWALLLISLS